MDEHYTCDGVVLHSDSELSKAADFCERVNSIDCGDGRFPNIVTFDMFSEPNEQIISNLDRAVKSGRVVFCSEEYYKEDPFGYFSANVAMLSQCNFVKMKFDKEKSAASSAKCLPSLASFTGLQVEDDWSFSEVEKTKLRKLFGWNKSKTGTGMPELPGDGCLDVANPSMPSMTRIPSRQTQNIAGESLESDSVVSGDGADQTSEGTYTFSGEQVNVDETQLPETKPEDKEPVIVQAPVAVSGHTITQTESQAPLISVPLQSDTNTQQTEQSPRSHPCLSGCSLCSYLSRCSTKSCATCGAILVFVIVLSIVVGISANRSN